MVTKRPKRAAQARGKRTRENLLRAAIDSMVESHVYGMRFAQISKIANVPQPLLDYHFPSLEALLSEMVAFQHERLSAAASSAIEKNSSSPRKALAAYIRAPFLMGMDDAGFRAVWSCSQHLGAVSLTFADYNRDTRASATKTVSTLIDGVLAFEKRDENATPKKVTEVALSIQGIMTGFAALASCERDGNYRGLADLAVKAAFQILDASFPLPV